MNNGVGSGIGQGIEKFAQYYMKSKESFLSSMQAVEKMKMEREKFDLDKKVSNAQLDRLALDMDPEQHALKTKLTKSQINLAEVGIKHKELVVKEASKTLAQKFKESQSALDMFTLMQRENPGIAPRMTMDSKGIGVKAQAPDKAIPKDVYDQISKQAVEIATKKTKNTKKTWWGGSEPDPLPDEVMASRDELIKQFRGAPGAVSSPGAGGGDSGLPDPSEYNEGALIGDDNKKYRLTEGAWVEETDEEE